MVTDRTRYAKGNPIGGSTSGGIRLRRSVLHGARTRSSLPTSGISSAWSPHAGRTCSSRSSDTAISALPVLQELQAAAVTVGQCPVRDSEPVAVEHVGVEPVAPGCVADPDADLVAPGRGYPSCSSQTGVREPRPEASTTRSRQSAGMQGFRDPGSAQEGPASGWPARPTRRSAASAPARRVSSRRRVR